MQDLYFVRRDKVRRRFVKSGLDAILISSPINVRYLTGFTGGDSQLLIFRTGSVLLSDPRFTIQIEEESPGLEVIIRPGGVSMSQAISKRIGKTTAGKLGIEGETMTLVERDRIALEIPSWKLVSTQGIVEELRQIKDRSEIASIRKAIDAAYHGFTDVRSVLKPDWTEIDIRNELEYRMRIRGAEEKSFASIVAAGARGALPHAIPSPQKIGGQPLLLFDWGAIVDGYMSDLTRVLILTPTRKLKTVYETVLKAQEAAIAAVKPGKTGEEIDAVARSVIRDAGFGRYFNHGLGHALGLEIHESPRFAIGHDTAIKPGMVMTVEPGIYIKGWGGVRIEDDILVTKTGCEILSRHVPKKFDDMLS